MSVEYKDSGITLSLSDSVTPSDSLIKGIDPVYADSASASDAIVKSFSIPLADSMTPSDDLVKLVSIPLADSVTVNDEIFNHPGKHLTDSATPIDAIIEKDVGKPIVDSITPVDSITTKHFGKVLVDSVTADDTTNVLFKDRSDILFENRNGVVWTETRRDMIVKHIEKPLTDSATPSDLITDKFVTMVLTDSITITDNIYNHPGLFFWDEYEYSDLITVMKLDGAMPYVKPENTAFSEMRIKSVSGREPSNFYEVDEQGEEE